MELNYRRVDPLNDEDLNVLLRGMNDPQIRHLVTPNFREEELPLVTLEDYRASILGAGKEVHRFIIFDDKKAIGDLSLAVDPDHLFLCIPNSGWLGICISDGDYRGRGIGRMALEFIEGFAWERGLVRIELGVFSYNEPAIRLYQKAGYHEIGRIPNFVWYKDRWWADIRMEKMKPSQD